MVWKKTINFNKQRGKFPLKGTTFIDYYTAIPHKQLYYSDAATNKGKCAICRKEIPKGTPVFWYWDKFRKWKKNVKQEEETAKPTDLNIKRKICFRCINEEVFNHLLEKYDNEIKKIKIIRKSFKRSLTGKRCKRAIENCFALEELQKEDFVKNFPEAKFNG